jgi:hypothetical protein
VHSPKPSAIRDIPGDRGAEAERRNFAVNVQPGHTVSSGPNGDINAVPSANATVGGNLCDEGVLDGRCIVQQPVRFDGDYTISGRSVCIFCILQRTKIHVCVCVCVCVCVYIYTYICSVSSALSIKHTCDSIYARTLNRHFFQGCYFGSFPSSQQ